MQEPNFETMTKSELKQLLTEDLQRYGGKRPGMKDHFVRNEKYYLYTIVRCIRMMEYHKGKAGLSKLLLLYYWYRYKRLSLRFSITLYPDTFGGGLRIYHTGGFTHIGKNCRIGKNCTILPGVVFGNKHEAETDDLIIVGDNCYFGLGARIFAPVKIGNNVIVGANSVVTKDIPDNAVVGGIPARIIRMNNQK